MNITDTIMKIDWVSLRGQKAWLLSQTDEDGNITEYVEGLINLIDSIQDSVVDSGLETSMNVFGFK